MSFRYYTKLSSFLKFAVLTAITLLSFLVYFNYFNLVPLRAFLHSFEPIAILVVFVLAAIITTKIARTIVLIAALVYYVSPLLLQSSCNFTIPTASLKSKLNHAAILETILGSTQIWILQTNSKLNTWESYTMVRRLALAAYTLPNSSVIFFPRSASFRLPERLLQKIAKVRYVCTAGDFNIFVSIKVN